MRIYNSLLLKWRLQFLDLTELSRCKIFNLKPFLNYILQPTSWCNYDGDHLWKTVTLYFDTWDVVQSIFDLNSRTRSLVNIPPMQILYNQIWINIWPEIRAYTRTHLHKIYSNSLELDNNRTSLWLIAIYSVILKIQRYNCRLNVWHSLGKFYCSLSI